MNATRFAVTGGCGFLGQHITAELLRTHPGSTVCIVDLKANPYSVFDWTTYPSVETRLGVDVCADISSLKAVFSDVDVVVHAAGVVGFSLADGRRLYRVHEEGTSNVLAACSKANVSRMVHVSSVAALGFADREDVHVDETFVFDWDLAEKRKKHYMISKRRADLVVEQFRARGIDVRIAYPSLMYGPGDAFNSVHVIRAIRAGRIPFIMPGGNAVSDVRDVASGIVSMCDQDHVRESFILAAHNFSSEQLFEVLGNALEVEPPKRRMPRTLGPILFWTLLAAEKVIRKEITLSADSIDSAFRYRYFDATKARSQLNWRPRAFETTVNDTLSWLEDHDLLES